jgi:malic enzyme
MTVPVRNAHRIRHQHTLTSRPEAQPKCFRILDTLRARLTIPVWHDDQQGTVTVLLAALLNALKLVNKDLSRIKLALIGLGAANVATYRLLKASGIDQGGYCLRQQGHSPSRTH